MWLRLRLDIGWRDLGRGLLAALIPGGHRAAMRRLEALWSPEGDALACLSVRSGFDLLLQSLELPAGSEVLFSAITIRDMPHIAEAHGLVPVPVDLAGSDSHVDVEALRTAITSRSRVLVVAHLFGARPEMGEVLRIAREHQLFVVEDCAQAWCGADWRGDTTADAALFSFGAIKTATALGGALCRVNDADVLARMRAVQEREPVQSGRSLPLKVAKFAALKGISSRAAFGLLAATASRLGRSVDQLLGGLTRGFSEGGLLEQLRQQPAAGTLRLLRHRLRTYDTRRIGRRVENARRIMARLGLEEKQPELLDPRHTFWLFPYLCDRPEALIAHLRRNGFDATQRGRMEVVTAPADRPELSCPRARELLNRTVFLPCYPEMSPSAMDRLCDALRSFEPNLSESHERPTPQLTR